MRTSLAVFAAYAALTGCNQAPSAEPKSSPPQPVITLAASIEAATDDGLLLQAGEAASDALAELQSDLTDDTREVRIEFSRSGRDRLGQPEETSLFRLSFSANDVRRADFGQLSGPDVLDLATSYRPANSAGAAIVNRSCNAQIAGQISDRLCSLLDSIPA